MRHTGLLVMFGVACLVVVIVVVVFMLRRGSTTKDGPEVAAATWVNALFAGDTDQLRRLTCDARQDDLQRTASLLSGAGQLRGVGVKVSATNLSFDTTERTDTSAVVRVRGKVQIRLLLASQSEDLNVSLKMLRERDRWKFCDLQLQRLSRRELHPTYGRKTG